MVVLSLRIHSPETGITRPLQVNQSMQVYDVGKLIREKLPEVASLGQPREYGLYIGGDDPRHGYWLDNAKTLEYYVLNNGHTLEYKRKIRPIRVRTLDGATKTVLIDDSQIVKHLIPYVCGKIGINNHDEFGLVRDESDVDRESRKAAENNSNGTLRFSTLSREQKKMEKLKREIVTDDDTQWLDLAQTLQQQGIDYNDMLLLKRRYFYSDQNIDSSDPVQLNLMYVQCRDSILNGTHPVTHEQALKLGGLQLFSQFGLEPVRSGLPLDARDYLPRSYARSNVNAIKNVDKRLREECAKHSNLTDSEAKRLYIEECRSMKTYGVTFFLVKEKMKGRNKLVPRLLGVQRDSVLRLDERTKEVLTQWPLTQVKRWAASPNTFTLDFGDYADEYYSVQTQEGEQISQLIAGYVDIILKRLKPKDHFGLDSEEACIMEEDEVLPAKLRRVDRKVSQEQPIRQAVLGNIAVPAVLRIPLDKKPTIPRRAEPPRLLDLPSLYNTLDEPPQRVVPVPDYESPPIAVQKQNVATQVTEITRQTANMVNLTSEPEWEQKKIDKAADALLANVNELAHSVKVINALDERDGPDLLAATKRMIKAVQDLLDAAKLEVVRQALLVAASEVGDVGKEIATIIHPPVADTEQEQALMTLAKAVANTAAELVRRAKHIAKHTQNPEQQDRIIQAATAAALAASELVTKAKLLQTQPVEGDRQTDILAAARRVAKTVQDLIDACKLTHPPKPMAGDLNEAARKVTEALNNLLRHFHIEPKPPKPKVIEQIQASAERVLQAQEPTEVMRSARSLATATADLVKSIKTEAEHEQEKDLQRRLFGAAKELADKVQQLIDAAKLYAQAPEQLEHRQTIRHTATEIQEIVKREAIKRPPMTVEVKEILELTIKTTDLGRKMVEETERAEPLIEHPGVSQRLHIAREVAEPRIGDMEEATVKVQKQYTTSAMTDLRNAILDAVDVSDQVQRDVQRALPAIRDQDAQRGLSETTKTFHEHLYELTRRVDHVLPPPQPPARPPQQDGLQQALRTAVNRLNELEAYERIADTTPGGLQPVVELPFDAAQRNLQDAARRVTQALSELCSAATVQNQPEHLDRAAKNTSAALDHLTTASYNTAAATDNIDTQREILHMTKQVLIESITAIQSAASTQREGRPSGNLLDAARHVSQAVGSLLEHMPAGGDQNDLNQAIQRVEQVTKQLDRRPRSPSAQAAMPYVQLEQELNEAGSRLSESVNEVVHSTSETITQLAHHASNYSYYYEIFIDKSFTLMGQHLAGEREGEQIRSDIHRISDASVRLLKLAKNEQQNGSRASSSLTIDPSSRQKLNEAAREVTETISTMLSNINQSGSVQRQIDSAIRRIQDSRQALEASATHAPAPGIGGYKETVDTVTSETNELAKGMNALNEACQRRQYDALLNAVQQVADSVSKVAEAAGQCAYTVGVSHETSHAGHAGPVDPQLCTRAQRTIHDACDVIESRTSESSGTRKEDFQEATTTIAKYTSLVVNACRNALPHVEDPQAKQRLIDHARAVAHATANLVKAIKPGESGDKSGAQPVHGEVQTLRRAIDDLTHYVQQPQFVGQPAQIGSEGRALQQPIVRNAQDVINSASNMLSSTKVLFLDNEDRSKWQKLGEESKKVVNSLGALVNAMHETSPGKQETEQAIDKIKSLERLLEQAALAAVSQRLEKRQDKSARAYYEQTLASVAHIQQLSQPAQVAGVLQTDSVGQCVRQLIAPYDTFVSNAIGAASHTDGSSRQQMAILDQSKTVLEATVELFHALKQIAGARSSNNSARVDFLNASKNLVVSLQDSADTLQRLLSERGMMDAITQHLQESIYMADSGNLQDETQYLDERFRDMGFVDYQGRMIAACREITRLSQEISVKAPNQSEELGGLVNSISHQYRELAQDSRGAQRSCAPNNVELRQALLRATQDLGQTLLELCKQAGRVQYDPNNQQNQRTLGNDVRSVNERVSHLLNVLQSGSKGTQACIDAASTVSGIIGDLDTTIMFASVGTLQPRTPNETFDNYRNVILDTAKALTNDSKSLVSGAASSQEQLAFAAQQSVKTVLQLADVVKDGAATLGKDNIEGQVLLLNAVRDVVGALGDLITATKTASGKNIQSPEMQNLKASATAMITNVQSLMKTLKTVEDETVRGTHALASALQAVDQEIKAYESPQSPAPPQPLSGDDLVRATKLVTESSSRAVAAGYSVRQHDALEAANMGRRAISEFLSTSKGAIAGCDVPETRVRLYEASRDCAARYKALLEVVFRIFTLPAKGAGASQGEKDRLTALLPEMTRALAQSVNLVVANAESLNDSAHGKDEMLFTEQELLGSVGLIQESIKRLQEMRIPPASRGGQDLVQPIINDARNSLISAQDLIKVVSQSYRDMVENGRISARPAARSEDGMWAEGITQTSRAVAIACHSLVGSAEALTAGHSTEEKLISSAKQVASFTAQMLVSARNKADPNSQSMQMLPNAGNNVKHSTDQLIRSAQMSIDSHGHRSLILNPSIVGGMAQEITAQEEVLRKEKELEEAQARLRAIRKAKYADRSDVEEMSS